jgi:hypothetical protein
LGKRGLRKENHCQENPAHPSESQLAKKMPASGGAPKLLKKLLRISYCHHVDLTYSWRP